jgi:hypothetical protein
MCGTEESRAAMIAPWGWIAVAYGGVLAVAAMSVPRVPRRGLLAAACLGYVLAALAAGSFAEALWVQVGAPGALLLAGYWLSGPFFRDPQPWLEQRLLAIDHRIFALLGLDPAAPRVPRSLLNGLEAVYAGIYIVVGLAALLVATDGTAAVARYWTLALGAGLCCYVTLPWLRARPPRVLELMAAPAGPSLLRRLNTAVLDRASVQAATIPSGHVAVAVAAAAGVFPVSPSVGGVLLALSGLVAVAAFLGRYHYAFDCVGGLAVGGLVSAL